MPTKSALPRLPDRWNWRSLRLRILLATMIWVALGIGGIWFSASRLFAKHVELQYHEELEVHVKELAGLVQISGDGRISLFRPLSDPRYLVPLSGFYWQVGIGKLTPLRSPSMTRGSLDDQVAHSGQVEHQIEGGPTGPAIVYGFSRPGPGGQDIHYVIATDQRLLDEAISSFTRELTVWLLALGSALLATGLAIVAIGFRPLDRLSRTIASLRRGDMSRLGGRFPSEIVPLVDDLNAYIDHNRQIVERGRVEAGSLAHALRTPLAVITDEAERLAKAERTKSAADAILDQTRLMVEQIDFRLARARSAAGKQLVGANARISEILPPILSAMERLHPDKKFYVANASHGQVTLPVDPVDLAELLSNLLDNSGKWAKAQVEICLSDMDVGSIVIADDGPGMTAEQLRTACDIGVRFDGTKPGSGLGLAIACDIAHAYDLELEFVRQGKLGGLQVRLGTRTLRGHWDR